jgi:hypothetical protein
MSEASVSLYDEPSENEPSEEEATKTPYIDGVAGLLANIMNLHRSMSENDDDGATVSLGLTGSDKEGATKSASNNDENKAELSNTQSKDDNTSAKISAEGLASNSNETNSNRGASNDDDRVASEGDTSTNTSVEERASNNIPNRCDHFLWPNLPRPGCPDKPMDIHCFLCLAYGLQKKLYTPVFNAGKVSTLLASLHSTTQNWWRRNSGTLLILLPVLLQQEAELLNPSISR